jgi:hypothetical protein
MSHPLKVCLVLKDRGWILEKMAIRLAEHLPNWNVESEIAYFPSPTADVNHWMLYNDVEGDFCVKNTLAITHVDRTIKLHVLKQRLKKADLGICMSRMTLEQLVLSGIPRQKLCYITPAHDGNIKPSRIVIGITSQIRPDGAKREEVLIQMAQMIRLDLFHFEIIGPNWEKVIPFFKMAGATVEYNPGAYLRDNSEHLSVVMSRLNFFDYYLYMGCDEGSMGFLDALAAGIPTIVTPQGFHLDINGGITYSFTDASELCVVFKKLAHERQQRIDSVSGLTWNEYARQHALVWRALVEGHYGGLNAMLHDRDTYNTPLPDLSNANWVGIASPVKTKNNVASVIGDLFLLWELYTKTKFQKTSLFRLARFAKRSLTNIART